MLVLLTLIRPRPLVLESQCIEVLRSCRNIVDPFSQQRTAVDDIDGESVALILVSEIAPQRVVRVQSANCLESERLDPPWLECRVIVIRTVRVYLHAMAKLAGMFVKRRFEPAFAQAATIEPARSEGLHFLHD